MKKFAFLVHLRNSYRKDLRALATPLGWIPDAVYRLALRNRPLAPFIWSDVTLTPNATEPEGHIIMLPYTGQQLLKQQNEMVPCIEEALALAASKGAEIMGLSGLISSITQDGKRVNANPYLPVTNGNTYTSVMLWQRLSQLIRECHNPKPVVALLGATGSVGRLVSTLLAKHQDDVRYLLIDGNSHRLYRLAADMRSVNSSVDYTVSQQVDKVKQADIVVVLASAVEHTLQAHHLKVGAVVLDDTQVRNTQPSLLTKRPDVTVIDGGLVATPNLRFHQRSIGLPNGISYARLAETMLLAQARYPGNFSVDTPTLAQAEYISTLAHRFSHLGFGLAPDHSFGKAIFRRAIVARKSRPVPELNFIPIRATSSVSFS
ncbi:saccharopine dehydrogenase NADP-binding domain-containing protein [Spirosoma validum]|uniref:Shikimate dehydrogenase n=1 Tax=Spirosoma validum TaxID=2771355 RepID=A0A927AX82_9BACT|nr:shikimate dehydrogenase [Spirosoma validum]MBD2751425.1 shikimate dehydrogenase [Spirosoma validum]